MVNVRSNDNYIMAVIRTSGGAVERLERRQHGLREVVGVLLHREVQPVHLPVVAPLVECRRRLIVLEALQYGAVYHHLEKLQ